MRMGARMRRTIAGSATLLAGLCVLALIGAGSSSAVPRAQGQSPRPLTWVAADGVSNSVPNTSGKNGYCYSKHSCYNYVSALVDHNNKGAEDDLKQASPKLGRNAYHSLEEIAVRSTNGKQIVEIGWTSQKSPGHPAHSVKPRLFVFHWINGKGTCYSAPGDWCGFHSTSKTIQPMMHVKAGQIGHYSIGFKNGRWNLAYDHKKFGYFPESQWHGNFTTAGYVQTFGEIAATAKQTCTQMGNGLPPGNPKASTITNFRLYGSTVRSESFTVTQTRIWNYKLTKKGFRLGGQGDCST
jgi:hypothetical protein